MWFNYEWSFDDEDRIDDVIVDDILLISRDYELYLLGMELDYNYDDFESFIFTFKNLNNFFVWLWNIFFYINN